MNGRYTTTQTFPEYGNYSSNSGLGQLTVTAGDGSVIVEIFAGEVDGAETWVIQETIDADGGRKVELANGRFRISTTGTTAAYYWSV